MYSLSYNLNFVLCRSLPRYIVSNIFISLMWWGSTLRGFCSRTVKLPILPIVIVPNECSCPRTFAASRVIAIMALYGLILKSMQQQVIKLVNLISKQDFTLLCQHVTITYCATPNYLAYLQSRSQLFG